MNIKATELLDKIDVFLSASDPRQSELLLSGILLPLLEHEGYSSIRQNITAKLTPSRTLDEWDLVVERSKNDRFMEDSIGVEVKTYTKKKADKKNS